MPVYVTLLNPDTAPHAGPSQGTGSGFFYALQTVTLNGNDPVDCI